MSGCSCTSFVCRFGNTRSPRFSRISAFRPSQTTIQSPLPIFILVMRCSGETWFPFEMGSKMLFEILKGLAELRQSLLQTVRQHRRPDQVRCRTVVVGPRRLGAEIAPVVEIAVTAAEPHQSDEVDLLVHIQPSNKA